MRRDDRSLLSIGCLIFSALALIFVTWQLGSNKGLQRGKMPPCDSSVARTLLTKTFAESPGMKLADIKLVKIADIVDLENGRDEAGRDPAKDGRLCDATVFTNAGKDTVTFRLSWMNTEKTEIWLEGQ